ncbi:hypothetical protein FPQ18DRAFT_304454 [Pyronema domesticum]|uniref:Uncharacterized protein n=1 Tax=Pyronema omphalodes (strain CBS 100304) TaxID=1076935 RepID=U4LM48_PYROM|nr:hypothetical protein FPQ18DRAFT_304454 [Pyronema domesticum]CCX33013.1 Protein of unknown function [Pyronema omphalodes CBS 100304]
MRISSLLSSLAIFSLASLSVAKCTTPQYHKSTDKRAPNTAESIDSMMHGMPLDVLHLQERDPSLGSDDPVLIPSTDGANGEDDDVEATHILQRAPKRGGGGGSYKGVCTSGGKMKNRGQRYYV